MFRRSESCATYYRLEGRRYYGHDRKYGDEDRPGDDRAHQLGIGRLGCRLAPCPPDQQAANQAAEVPLPADIETAGGEWKDDIAANIAPVLRKFVRGEYSQRKSRVPPTARGIRL